jgi:hypothetical protein
MPFIIYTLLWQSIFSIFVSSNNHLYIYVVIYQFYIPPTQTNERERQDDAIKDMKVTRQKNKIERNDTRVYTQ